MTSTKSGQVSWKGNYPGHKCYVHACYNVPNQVHLLYIMVFDIACDCGGLSDNLYRVILYIAL